MQARKTVKFKLHWHKISNKAFKCYIPPRTLDNLISGHIQVGIKTVLVAGTVHQIQYLDLRSHVSRKYIQYLFQEQYIKHNLNSA